MAKKSIVVNGESVKVFQEQILMFQNKVEALVKSDGLTYLEAISHYCELSDIELESVNAIISPVLLEKLTKEAIENNLIKSSSNPLLS
jgi:hypothetical protein